MTAIQTFQELSGNALADFYYNFKELYPVFYNSFCRKFEELCRAAKDICKFPVASLDFTLFRTDILDHRYRAEVIAYGEGHFFAQDSIILGEIDLSAIYKDYEALYDTVLKEARKYPQDLSVYDAQAYLLSVCGYFYQAFTYVLRTNICELSLTSAFRDIPFAEDYEINCGEYMALTETIWVRHRSETQEHKSGKLRRGIECIFSDFTKLSLYKETYRSMDMRCSDFSYSRLDGCTFEACLLDFCRLKDVSARDTCFSACVLSGADFTRADLRDAIFASIDIDEIIEDGTEQEKGGKCHLPQFDMNITLSFRNANLKRAVFSECILTHADFTGANLESAQFDEQSLNTAVLSDSQREEIILLEL